MATAKRNNKEDFFLPIHSICPELFPTIVEKMTNADFAKFCECDQFSNEMCLSLPNKVKQAINVYQMEIYKEHFEVKFFKNTFEVRSDRRNLAFSGVVYFCDYLKVNSSSSLELLKRLTVKIICLQLGHQVTAPMAKDFVTMTLPSCIKIDYPTKELLNLYEIQTCQQLTINTPLHNGNSLNDEILLKLKSTYLFLECDTNVTIEGVLKLIEQWYSKEREIRELRLGMAFRSSYNSLVLELKENYQLTAYGQKAKFICRDENHTDCLKMSNPVRNGTRIRLVGGQPCPGFKNREEF